MAKKITPVGNSTFALIQLIGLFGLSFLIISGIFSYIMVETRTAFYSDRIDGLEQACKLENQSLKYIKILDYQKYKDFAKVYCAYNDSLENRSLELNYRSDKWNIVLDTGVNKERSLHWPIYF